MIRQEAYREGANSLAERDLSGTRIEGAIDRQGIRVLALPTARPRGYVLDVDGTIYKDDAYRKDVAQREIDAIGDALAWPSGEAAGRLRQHRESLGERLGRSARLTETVVDLGLTREWWDTKRNEVYRPEAFLSPDPHVSAELSRLSQTHQVAVATNSPSGVAHRILEILGVDEATMSRIQVFGPDILGVAKPDSEYFTEAARRLGVSPEECISIGDDEQNDAYPAIEAGMGAIIVSDPAQISPVIAATTHESQFTEFDLAKFVSSQYIPGEIRILRLTGRAGAGKTTTAGKMLSALEQLGIPAAVLGLDAFFKLSSRQRREWLEAGKQLGEDEYARRADQAAWWNFDRAAETIDQLRQGNSVHLQGIYNRADRGELTGELKITPHPKKGMVVIFEGVAVAHLPKNGDHILYVNAHPKTRRERLLGRDQHRAGDTAIERFKITQGFENGYFPNHLGAIDSAVDNSNGFLMKVPAIPQL